MILCDRQQGLDQLVQQGTGLHAGLPGVHTGVQHALVVAAAARMQPLAGLADPLDQDRFYIHMDIFGFSGPLDLSFPRVSQNAFQAFYDFFRVLWRDDVFLAQHGGVGDGTQNILFV